MRMFKLVKTSEGLRVVCMWILNEEERERSEDLWVLKWRYMMMKEVVAFVILSRRLNRDILPGVVLEQGCFRNHNLSHKMLCVYRFICKKHNWENIMHWWSKRQWYTDQCSVQRKMAKFIKGWYQTLWVLRLICGVELRGEEAESCLKTFPLTMRNSCVIKTHNQTKLW